MKYKLQDLIDIEQFQSLQEPLNEIYSFPSALIDNVGNIVTAFAGCSIHPVSSEIVMSTILLSEDGDAYREVIAAAP